MPYKVVLTTKIFRDGSIHSLPRNVVKSADVFEDRRHLAIRGKNCIVVATQYEEGGPEDAVLAHRKLVTAYSETFAGSPGMFESIELGEELSTDLSR